MNGKPLSPTLLTADTSVLLLVDYQEHVMKTIYSTDHELIELNGRALARAGKAFGVPVILSTIGQKLRNDEPTLPSIRSELADQPEIDRDTMNAWEDDGFRQALKQTGRKRLIFAGLTTEVCLMYPVLHAARDGYETYFVVDAVGGLTTTAHETAIKRMIQAGAQPITFATMMTEWIRNWRTTPYFDGFSKLMEWYAPQMTAIRARLRQQPYAADLI